MWESRRGIIVASELLWWQTKRRTDSYKLILVFLSYVCVYKSTCNIWVCRAYPELVPAHPRGRPWGFPGECTWGYVGASAYVRGRFYFAELEVRGIVVPIYSDDIDICGHSYLRVYELDDEAGIWNPRSIRHALRNFFLQNPVDDHGFRLGSYLFEIVECMEGMYAVIPAEVDMLLVIGEMRRTYDS